MRPEQRSATLRPRSAYVLEVLVVNRGEIAVRVLRALRELGVGSVAVYSEADREALHVRHADESFLLGEAAPAASTSTSTGSSTSPNGAGAEAIHPGYGFLAENADFARAITKAGFVFVGPPPEAIERMGDKVAARQAAVEAGAPVVPGTLEPVAGTGRRCARSPRSTASRSRSKLSFGGGGRGFKVVRSDKELYDAFASAQRESAMSFGRDEVYLERYLEGARHIEAQILADKHGNVLFLGERDCTLQRRHQKLVEESPSPVVSEEVRRALGESSVSIARTGRVRQRRHDRDAARRRSEELLLHGDEHAPTGRAPGDRAVRRHRPRPMADQDRCRRGASVLAIRHPHARPRDRMPDQHDVLHAYQQDRA